MRVAYTFFTLSLTLFCYLLSPVDAHASQNTTGFHSVSQVYTYIPATGWIGSPENIMVSDDLPFTSTYTGVGNIAMIFTNISFPTIPSNAEIIKFNFKLRSKHSGGVGSGGGASIKVRRNCSSSNQASTITQLVDNYYSIKNFTINGSGGVTAEDINSGDVCIIPTISIGPNGINDFDHVEAEIIYNYQTPTPTIAPTATIVPTQTPVDVVLDVPYLSQNDPAWGYKEYDHAASLGFQNATIERWGCAVTSIAMLLRYHGMTQMPDGTHLTPSSVNDWLKANNGFSTGGNGRGSYSYLVWNAVSRLTQKLYNEGKSTIKLEHKRAYASDETDQLLKDDIILRNSPPIFGVNNTTHFVAVNGFNDDTFLLNDPEWGYDELLDFTENTYSQADRFIRSNTDLSNVTIVINPNVEMLLIDSSGRKTGRVFEDGLLKVYNEIPEAFYANQPPLASINEFGEQESLGTGVNELYIAQPNNDRYTLIISSTENDTYTLNLSAFQENGDAVQEISSGIISSETNQMLVVDYKKELPTKILKQVTYASIIKDLELLIDQGFAQAHRISNIQAMLKNAQKHHEKGNTKAELVHLENAIKFIERAEETSINQIGKTILLKDLQKLQENLQNNHI